MRKLSIMVSLATLGVAACGATSVVKAPSATTQRIPASTTGPSTTVVGGAASDDVLVTASIADITAYWSQVLPTVFNGQKFAPVRGGLFLYTSTSKIPPCPGVASYSAIANNAFYCNTGDLVAWDDEKLIPTLRRQYGDFTISIVMAHELGHAVQARTKVVAKTVTKEQQADCYAGAWVASVWNGYSKNFKVGLAELDKAVAGFLELRDPLGTDANSSSAHGSAFDRIGAFQDGFINGAKPCSVYTDSSVAATLVELPFTTKNDAQSGGNLPFTDAVKSSYRDLEDFWSTVFRQANKPWTPLANRVDVNADLAHKAYEAIGDFSVSTLIGHQYAIEVQKVVGEAGNELQRSLQADCLTGTWAASLVLHDRPNAAFQLSPGDLDESVATLLVLGDPAPSVDQGKSEVGSSFQRITAFRTGFLGGIADCAKIIEK